MASRNWKGLSILVHHSCQNFMKLGSSRQIIEKYCNIKFNYKPKLSVLDSTCTNCLRQFAQLYGLYIGID
jgi:hypothetical protein